MGNCFASGLLVAWTWLWLRISRVADFCLQAFGRTLGVAVLLGAHAECSRRGTRAGVAAIEPRLTIGRADGEPVIIVIDAADIAGATDTLSALVHARSITTVAAHRVALLVYAVARVCGGCGTAHPGADCIHVKLLIMLAAKPNVVHLEPGRLAAAGGTEGAEGGQHAHDFAPAPAVCWGQTLRGVTLLQIGAVTAAITSVGFVAAKAAIAAGASLTEGGGMAGNDRCAVCYTFPCGLLVTGLVVRAERPAMSKHGT